MLVALKLSPDNFAVYAFAELDFEIVIPCLLTPSRTLTQFCLAQLIGFVLLQKRNTKAIAAGTVIIGPAGLGGVGAMNTDEPPVSVRQHRKKFAPERCNKDNE